MENNKCRAEDIVDKLQAATRFRGEGMSCPDALMAAYQEEMGDRLGSAKELAARIPEILGEPELCDVFAVTFAIISHLTGIEDSYKETITRIREEYGSCKCGSEREDTPLCTQRMKDCVLMIQWARKRCRT